MNEVEDYSLENGEFKPYTRPSVIYIAEPTKDYETIEQQNKLISLIQEQGFKKVGDIENRGKFIYLTGIKI
jgi:hypothetical protein